MMEQLRLTVQEEQEEQQQPRVSVRALVPQLPEQVHGLFLLKTLKLHDSVSE